MSFLLKSPEVATVFAELARSTKFTCRRKKLFPSRWRHPFEIIKTFVRSCAVAPETYSPQSKTRNIQEVLYQKSVSQVYFDSKYKGYTFREDLNDAWYTLKSSAAFTTEQTVLLIKSCGHNLPLESISQKLTLVKDVWSSFDSIGIKKTIAHYNALLGVYIELEHKFSPMDFLSNLEKQGLVPNLETYKKLLHALSIQGNIGISPEILEHMKMHSVSVDRGVFNSLILGYSLQGDFISARGILELMKEKQLTLSSESYVSLALGYAKQGDIEKVKEIVDECRGQTKMLSTMELLELAYTFAINRHSEHFSTILDMIPLRNNFPTISTKVVHRLLHQNLDKEALILFEFRDRIESICLVQESIQMFLDHYVRFRKPSEVLDMAEIFREKGWSPIALAYCLKETFIRKDVPHSLNFLQAMKTRKYPVRVHYFYPILLKTRESGNEAVLNIIQHMNKYHVILSRETLKAFDKFYQFLPGAEFEDLEKLNDVGVDKKLVAWKILDILLYRRDVNMAIKLVSTYEIAHPAILLPLSMATSFRKLEDEYEKFVQILYYLIHNIKANKMAKQLNAEVYAFEYEQFIIEMVKFCSKTFSVAVMEEMSKMKIPLSPAAASFVLKRFSYPQINDLVSQLTSADLKFEFDETLLKRLIKKDEFHKRQEFLRKSRKDDWSDLYIALEENPNVPAVMKIFEDLAERTEPSNDKRRQNIVKRLFSFVSHKGDVVSTERIYEVGVQKNLIKEDEYAPLLIAHLVRGDSYGAVKRFHERLKATKKFKALGTLVGEIKTRNNLMALDDLRISISNVCGEGFAATKLLIEFAKLGHFREARKILQSKSQILKPLLDDTCRTLFKNGNVTYFETLEKASRNIDTINKRSLYYPLLRLYAVSGNLEKILNLYVELERDDAMTKTFRSIFLGLFKKWNGDIPEELENVLQCIKEDCEMRHSLKCLDTISCEQDFKDYLTEDVHPSFGIETESVSSFTTKDNVLKCFCLIHAGKLDEYFKVLGEKIAADGPVKASAYFFCYRLVPHMIKNQKHLDEYKELVMMCELPNLWKKYLKLCVRLGNAHGMKTAMKKLASVQLGVFLQDISFEDCLRVIENMECHRQLGKKIAIFYLKIINQCMNRNNFEMAKKYYEKAKEHKLELFLNSFANDLLKL